jgi:hypothetical protein
MTRFLRALHDLLGSEAQLFELTLREEGFANEEAIVAVGPDFGLGEGVRGPRCCCFGHELVSGSWPRRGDNGDTTLARQEVSCPVR